MNNIDTKIMDNILLQYSILKFENEVEKLHRISYLFDNQILENEPIKFDEILEILSYIDKNFCGDNIIFKSDGDKYDYFQKAYEQTNDPKIKNVIKNVIKQLPKLKNMGYKSFDYYINKFDEYFNGRMLNIKNRYVFIEEIIYEIQKKDIFVIFKYLKENTRKQLFKNMLFSVNGSIEKKLTIVAEKIIKLYPSLKSIELESIEKTTICENADIKFIKLLVDSKIIRLEKNDLYALFNYCLQAKRYDLCLYMCETIGVDKNSSDFIIEIMFSNYIFNDKKTMKNLFVSIINSPKFEGINKDALEKIEYYVSKIDFGQYAEKFIPAQDNEKIQILENVAEEVSYIDFEGDDEDSIYQDLLYVIDLIKAEDQLLNQEISYKLEQEYKTKMKEIAIPKKEFIDDLFIALIPKTPDNLQEELLEVYDMLTEGNLQTQREETLKTLNKILIKKNKPIKED